MKVRDLIQAMEAIAPLKYAASWDNVGLLVGSPERDLRGPALLTIDLTPAVLDEAAAQRCGAVVAYHPVVWEPMKRVTTETGAGRLLLRAAESGMAIYCPHTALDSAPAGMTDWLCEGLTGSGGADVRALEVFDELDERQEVKIVTFVPERDAERVRGALASAGAGLIGAYSACSFATSGHGTFLGGPGAAPAVGEAGRLETVAELRLEMVCSRGALPLALETLREFHPYEEPAVDVYELVAKPRRTAGPGRRLVLDHGVMLSTLADRLKRHLGVSIVRMACPRGPGQVVSKIGVCPGAGASLVRRAIADGCEVFVTGEMKHHEIRAANDAGLGVILAGHTNTERGFLPRLAARLGAALPALEVNVSLQDKDPLVTY